MEGKRIPIDQRAERTTLTPIRELRVLVHPLWMNKPQHKQPQAIERFDRSRKQMADAMVETMAPQALDEVTLFIPDVYEQRRSEEIRDQVRALRHFPEHRQWPDFMKSLIQGSSVKRNVIIGPNIVDGWEQKDNAILIEEKLKEKGLAITPSTSITIGGELLRACLDEVVGKILRLSQVRRVQVNKSATLSEGYLFNSHPMLEESDFRYFSDDYRKQGFRVIEHPDVIEIEKL